MAKWYVAGLHFQCTQCGGCCSGPDEGFIWLTKHEMKLIADFLKMDVSDFKKEYLERFGARYSIIEHPKTKDCIFLEMKDGQKKCKIYNVRPNQCRTWPFWTSNLKSIDTWNSAAQTCPGINKDKEYSIDDIEKLRTQKKWWDDDDEDR